VIEANQTEDGETYRNDRLVAVAKDAHNYQNIRSLRDISKNLRDELVHFFKSYNERNDKKFNVIAMREKKSAQTLVDKTRKAHSNGA